MKILYIYSHIYYVLDFDNTRVLEQESVCIKGLIHVVFKNMHVLIAPWILYTFIYIFIYILYS